MIRSAVPNFVKYSKFDDLGLYFQPTVPIMMKFGMLEQSLGLLLGFTIEDKHFIKWLWVKMRKVDSDRIQSFHMQALRRIFGIRWYDKVPNAVVN